MSDDIVLALRKIAGQLALANMSLAQMAVSSCGTDTEIETFAEEYQKVASEIEKAIKEGQK